MPPEAITLLLNIAIARKGQENVNSHIIHISDNKYNLNACMNHFSDAMRPYLGLTAKNKNWFKGIEPAENIGGTIIGPQKTQFGSHFQSVLAQVDTWMKQNA